MAEEISTAERRILASMRRKRSELEQLRQDIKRLKKELVQLRRNGLGGADLSRTSGARKLVVEHLITERLRQRHPTDVTSDELWQLVQVAGVKSRSTFRSHLRRMKERGLVISPTQSRWVLGPAAAQERVVSIAVQKAIERIDAASR